MNSCFECRRHDPEVQYEINSGGVHCNAKGFDIDRRCALDMRCEMFARSQDSEKTFDTIWWHSVLAEAVKGYLSEQGACGDALGMHAKCDNPKCSYCNMARALSRIKE